ncbi:PaaI family thioesterase [Rhodopseudomonas sp. HC1]|uniref:PaaI family thioesterase n=1 Tax=Rhodopseudomonas infernalis TaxID=2897386 RepID=UPI001EE8BD80|nr:PaaI family thioesterase [Rhodopseudomonas infernalis]MCG6205243.1 PaaI family thioesterase [Rhodopseudomonas infernalis]
MSTAAAKTLGIAELQVMADRAPFIAFCQLKVTEADIEQQVLTMEAPFRPEFERGPGTKQWHGGPLASIIDTVGDFAIAMLVGGGIPTINFRVDYLRPAVDTKLVAKATVRRVGRTVGVADIDVFNDKGVLVAIGRGSYAIPASVN